MIVQVVPKRDSERQERVHEDSSQEEVELVPSKRVRHCWSRDVHWPEAH